MSSWYTTALSSDFADVIGTLGGADLTTDPAPNSTPPAESRVFTLPINSGAQSLLGLVAIGGTATVVGWIYSAKIGTWVQIFSQALNTPGVMMTIGAGISTNSIPDNVPCFLQVTVVGTGCKVVAALPH